MTIATPSYVIPGTYLENVRFLDSFSLVSGIELLFFLFDEETDALFCRERDEILRYADRLSFSVHMPDPLVPEYRRLVELTTPLDATYVVHEPAKDRGSFAATITAWREEFGDRFFLENLADRSFASAAAELAEMPICLDTGHALLAGESPAGLAERYCERIREVHLHGVTGGKDHATFSGDDEWFLEMLPFLRRFDGTINIELFAIDKVMPVLETLAAAGVTDHSRAGSVARG